MPGVLSLVAVSFGGAAAGSGAPGLMLDVSGTFLEAVSELRRLERKDGYCYG